MEDWQRASSTPEAAAYGSEHNVVVTEKNRKCVQFSDSAMSSPYLTDMDRKEGSTKGLSGFRPRVVGPEPSRSCMRSRGSRASFDITPRNPTVDEFDDHLKSYLDAAAEGPPILISSHGRRSISVDSPYSGGQGTSHVVSKEYSDIEAMFRFGAELGRGASGIVNLCVDIQTGKEFACKTIIKGSLKCALDIQNLQTEVRTLQAMQQHSKVVGLKGVFESSKSVHLVMEYCEGGDLFTRIKQRRYFTEPEAASICASLASFLARAHQQGIMHRDLKPENILLVSRHLDTDIRIADFGSAAFFKQGTQLNQLIGSPLYIAPSVLQYSYGPEADLWSLGVVLYILLCGVPPFWGPTTVDILRSVQFGEVELEKGRWKYVSKGAKKLISRLLNRDGAKRITAAQVLKHPWILHLTGDVAAGKNWKRNSKIPPLPAKPARHMSAKEAGSSKALKKVVTRRRRAFSLSSEREEPTDSEAPESENESICEDGGPAVGGAVVELKSVLNRTPTPYRLTASGSDGDDDCGSADDGPLEREETLTLLTKQPHEGAIAVSRFFGGGASLTKQGDILDFRD